MVAKGNVVLKQGDTTLFCDEVHFSRKTNIAYAVGNVVLQSPRGEVSGDEITFNFATMEGRFFGARLQAYPYYGKGKVVAYRRDKSIEVDNGWVTTSDYDKPEFRVESKKIEVYPGHELVARHIQVKLGNFPVMYLPFFKHRLDDTQPKFLLTPGYDKDWGAFLLSQYRFYAGSKIKGTLHVDYRSFLGLGEGADVEYESDRFGSGLLRLYYADEGNLTSKLWDSSRAPTPKRQRYKIEWRHKWILDETTTAIWQYYQLSDQTFLKDYFERDFNVDSFPDTFFVLTKNLPHGTLSARTDLRINRFTTKVERKPEIQYTLSNTRIGNTGLYFKNISTFTNLVKKNPVPSDYRISTLRGDTNYELSYPTKIGFVEFKPYVGGEQTYYSKTIDPKKGELRNIFKGGAAMSARFFRTYDVHTNIWGLDINRLRHIITPQVLYEFTTKPSVTDTELNQFDSIDSRTRVHNINFSLENKLQTKRDGKTVELLRAITGVDYRLAEDARGKGFDHITTNVDFRPSNWLTLYFDSSYDTRAHHLDTANFDLFVNPQNNWSVGIGKRYNREVDDQITAQFYYKFNPKWRFHAFTRYDIDSNKIKEQDYILTRDLHAWEMDTRVHDSEGDGLQVLLLFRLKAFPQVGAITASQSFERQRSGSQSASGSTN